MKYAIEYTEFIDVKRLAALPKKTLVHMKETIEKKLETRPEVFGKPLRRSLYGYRSLRIGDYRVIYRIEEEKRTVKIFAIGHRSLVYKS